MMLGKDSHLVLEESKVLIVGCDHVGFEIAKNIVLSGVGTVVIHEGLSCLPLNNGIPAALYALAGEFNRNSYMDSILKQLLLLKGETQQVQQCKGTIDELLLSQFTAVVLNAPLGLAETVNINELARKLKVKCIGCEVRGLVGAVFSDFGEHIYKPSVSDYEPRTIISITNESSPLVTVADEDHGLYSDDTVLFSHVEGMPQINDTPLKVEVKDKTSFRIVDFDATKLSPGSAGVVQKIWLDQKIITKSLKENLLLPFRTVAKKQIREGLQLLWRFIEKNGRLPLPHSSTDALQFIQLSTTELTEEQQDFYKKFSYQASGCLSPMATLFGGVVGQEVLKACLNTFKPIGFTLFSALECLPENYLFAEDEEFIPETPSRYDGQIWCFGKEIQKTLEQRNLFVIGAGALGCEFLKMFATMGVACSPTKEGTIHVTDPDEISLSNLHRQFLFTASDVGKMKATVATQRCVNEINGLFNVKTHQLEVNEATSVIFNDTFWENLDEVIGAVDSVKAREFIDLKCHFYNIPFLESGTLGLKCSSNTHLPNLTPPYKGMPDPNAEIACSGKHFPFRPMHIVGWVNTYFKQIWEDSLNFYLNYLSISKKEEHLSETQGEKQANIDHWHMLRHASLDVRKQWAFSLLKTWLVDNPLECIEKHPRDEVNEEGVPFWSGTKIFPTPVEVNPTDPGQLQFVDSCVALLDRVFPKDGSIVPQTLDKDDPMHIEFICTATNQIARVYGIAKQTHSQIHQISGRIFAASLTTTAAIVGLVGLELYKVAQRVNLLSKLHFCQVDLGSNNILLGVPLEKLPTPPIPKWITVDLHRDIHIPQLYKYLLDKYYLKASLITFKGNDFEYPLDPSEDIPVGELVKREYGRRFLSEYSGPDRYWFYLEAEASEEYYNIKYRFK
uniref:Ubiquitin-activating enzyme E1 C-terminal domain-containing protein n=1 Tax=Arcella intermedia TaxID=1963864 RepID=A0A6B2KXM1_9EUKA